MLRMVTRCGLRPQYYVSLDKFTVVTNRSQNKKRDDKKLRYNFFKYTSMEWLNNLLNYTGEGY